MTPIWRANVVEPRERRSRACCHNSFLVVVLCHLFIYYILLGTMAYNNQGTRTLPALPYCIRAPMYMIVSLISAKGTRLIVSAWLTQIDADFLLNKFHYVTYLPGSHK